MSRILLQTDELTATLRDDGIVHVVTAGLMTADKVQAVNEPLHEMYREHAPVLHLLDVHKLETADLAARWQLSEMMKAHREFIKKSAVLGIDGAKRMTATVIVKVSGRNNVQFFSTEQEAVAWLLAPDAD